MRVLMCALALVTTQAHASLVACTDDNISSSMRGLIDSGQRIEEEGSFLMQLYSQSSKSQSNYVFDPAPIDYTRVFERQRFLQEQWLDRVIETRMWVDKCPKSSKMEKLVKRYQIEIDDVTTRLKSTNEGMPNAIR